MNKKLKEWEQASSSFDFDETFVLKQIQRNKHKKVYFNILKTCFAVLACIFVLTNTSHDYVKATKDIPILNKINELFSLNKNMLVAIENDYIQELNITKQQGDIKVDIDYMIVDEKNIYLFYKVYENNSRLDSEFTASIKIDDDGYSSSSHYTKTENYEILQFNLYYLEEDFVLNTFDFLVDYRGNEIIIPIQIDQTKIAKVRTHEVNQTYKINNQELIITKVNIYPLSMEIHTKQGNDNGYIVDNVEFEIKVNGKVRDKDMGIQATGFSRDTGIYDKTYYVPSTYFLGDDFSVAIKSVELIKKPGIVTYDLETNTFDDPTKIIKEIKLYTKETLKNPNPYQEGFEKYDYYFELQLNDHIIVEEDKGAVSLSWLGHYSDYKNDDGKTVYQLFINEQPQNNKFTFFPTVGEKVEVNKEVKLK